MTKIKIWMTGETVEINENELTGYETSCGETYENAYQLTDGRWVAYDEAVCAWVMLG